MGSRELTLPPGLTRLLDAAELLLEGAAEAGAVLDRLPEALAWSQQSADAFRRLAEGILQTGAAAELIEQTQAELQAIEEALQALAAGARERIAPRVEKAVRGLRSSSQRLRGLLEKLEAEAAGQPIYLPDPALDAFLKLGINHLGGALEVDALRRRFPAAVERVRRLRARVDRFRRLYEDPETARAALGALQTLEAGLGAVDAYLEEGAKAALEEGLRLLVHAGPELGRALSEVEEAARSQARRPRHLYLEELARAWAAGGDPALLEEAWNGVKEAVGGYTREVERAAEFPFLRQVESHWIPATQALERLRELTSGDPPGDLEALGVAFEELAGRLEALARAMQEELERHAQAPRFGELRLMVARALQGLVSRREMAEHLEGLRAMQEELERQLRESPDTPAVQELLGLLGRQAEGLARMEAWPGDPQPAHLEEGWAMVEETLPRMVEIQREMMSAEGAMAPARTPCIRCGASNPPERSTCQSCGARLPAAVRAPTEYTDITGGVPERVVPAHVLRLEELVAALERGEIPPEEASSVIDGILARVEKAGQGYRRQVAPQAAEDPVLAVYAGFFEERLEQFAEGLRTMRLSLEGGGPQNLRAGLAACRSAGDDLAALQHKIRQELHR